MKRILVTGAGGSAGINFIESLRLAGEKIYVVGADINMWHLALPSVDRRYLIPYYNHPSYIDKINSLIQKEHIEMVHAQPDVEVEVLSENRERIAANVLTTSRETIRTCRDKAITNIVLAKNNVPVPRSFLIEKIGDLPDMVKILKDESEVVWVRAVKGAGSKAALPVKTVRQIREWIHYWRATKQLESKDFMIAEYLPGREFAFQSLWKGGQLLTSQARERLEYVFGNLSPSGQSSSPSVARTVHRSDVNKIATQAVLAIDRKATGIFCVDLKENKDGVPCVTEINAGRFFTTSYFFAKSGSNMPWYYVKMVLGEKLPNMKQYNAIPENWYWIRLMDGGPILIKGNRWNCRKP